MRYLVLIPVLLFWLFLVIGICLLLLCACYCHMEKRRKTIQRDANFAGGGGTNRSKSQLQRKQSFVTLLKNYLYGLSRYMSIVIGKIPSHHLRKILVKYVLCLDIHSKAVLYGGFELRSPWNIKIGQSVIGVGALLDGRNGIVIEDDVCFAQAVSVYTLQHDVNDDHFGTTNKGGAVWIKHHAWVSSKTTILPQCVVEEGAVVASGATLTKSAEAYGIYGGIPAKKIGERKAPMTYHLNVEDYWRFY